MNIRLLARIIGLLLCLESAAMWVCAGFSYLDSNAWEGATCALSLSGGITVGVGVILCLFGRINEDRLPRREGIMIVGLAWVISGVFCALPFMLSEPRLGVSEAIFESVSGLTTTGATVIDDLERWPRGVLLWRALTQWLGGLGILVLFVALLSYARVGTRSLFANESSFKAGESMSARIRDTAALMWGVYLVLTACCFLGLKGLGMDWFEALTHTFATVSTGGFSIYNESIAYFQDWETGWLIEGWLIIFMLLSSINFLIYTVILRRRWSRLRSEEEAKWFFGILGLSIVIITAGLLYEGRPLGEAFRAVSFTVVSLASTTGFGTADYEQFPSGGVIILLFLMLLGGCSGSTSGGVKISRFIVALRCSFQEIVRAFRPNQVLRIQVNGNSLDERGRGQIILFITLFFLVSISAAMVISFLEAGSQLDVLTALGGVVGTLCNIGPAIGDLGPTDNYAWLRPSTKVFIALLMILGRLELFAILVLFLPSAWKKY